MAVFDWKSTFRPNFKMLKILGLWPDNHDGYKFDWYALYTLFCVNLCFIAPNFTQIVDLFLNTSNLETFTARIFLTLSEIMVPIKAFCHIKNISKGKELTQKLNASIFQPKTVTQRNLAQDQLNIWKASFRIFCVSCFMASVLEFSFPILDGTYKEFRLAIPAWFPYDFKRSPYFHITYLYQTVSVSFLTTADVILDMFVVALIIFVNAQCDILCDELKNNLSCRNFHSKFLQCVEHHKAILSFKETINSSYEMVIFWQTLVSSLAMALTMFHLTVVKFESSEVYGTVMCGMATSLEIALYCWFGNEAELKVQLLPKRES
ncbi:hypothetical protein Zmor_007605 [Zophobas morio]|uniref:7tm 6 domain containing protein n=1 Tax=Zophobas morio TaxID=2755281 RepID=A0AA38MM81_9CUCU|nr:hypothetical protein Zmor_007605 [Zophobas morio]